MPRFIYVLLGGLFSLATLGAVVGIGVIGAIFLTYGKDLPDHATLQEYEPATISRVYSGEGDVMDEFATERRLFTPIEEIPDAVKQAFISAEDKNFYNHSGYDLLGIGKALYDAAMGDRLRGASTITQQVAKNIFLSSDRSAERKIREILLAARMETVLNKDEILEIYLNEIFLGQNAYGVTSAAETYYGKRLEELALEEVAYLAALPKAPSDYHPVRQEGRAVARRNFVLKEMAENGFITDAEKAAARDAALKTVQGGDYASVRSRRTPRNYFTEEIRRQLSKDFGTEQFNSGGYTVRATMDRELQEVAAKALQDGLERYDRAVSPWRGPEATIDTALLGEEAKWRKALSDLRLPRDVDDWSPAVVLSVGETSARVGIEGVPEDEDGHFLSFKRENGWAKNRQLEDGTRFRIQGPKDMWAEGDVIMVKPERDRAGAVTAWTLRQVPEVQGGFMAMDTNTGRVLALQGGFSYQHSVFNRATQALRQPGSSIKPFVYASALDSGYSPVSIVVDAPIEIDTPQGLWRPQNASKKFYGPAPLRVGIEQSRNLMTIRLAQDVGMGTVAGYAERFGVYNSMQRVLAGSLGSQETTLYRMVAAYAMFANGGERVEPTMVDRVQDRFGKTVYRHDRRQCEGCAVQTTREGRSPLILSDRERVMDPVTAYQLTSMMRGVVERGTAKRTVTVDAPVAGKTGTTNDARDVWFVGFTPNIVAGCYMGYDTPRSMGKSASGGGMCGPVFNSFMEAAVKRYGAGKFEVPEGTVFLKFDRFTGARLPDDATGDHVIAELFREGEEPDYGAVKDAIDGGFKMGSDIELFSKFGGKRQDVVVKTASGKVKKIGKKATSGQILTGGQY